MTTARPIVGRGVVALLLACTATLLMATPALAHTSLRSSVPAKGAALATSPTSVTLTFGESVTLPADPITVTGPGGVAWAVGTPSVTGATVSAPVTATGPAGAYTIAWAVVSDDGDTIKGTIPFTLTAAATPTTTTPTTTAPAATPAAAAATTAATAAAPSSAAAAVETRRSGGGVPVWVWIVVAVVVLGGIGALAARSRRAGGS